MYLSLLPVMIIRIQIIVSACFRTIRLRLGSNPLISSIVDYVRDEWHAMPWPWWRKTHTEWYSPMLLAVGWIVLFLFYYFFVYLFIFTFYFSCIFYYYYIYMLLLFFFGGALWCHFVPIIILYPLFLYDAILPPFWCHWWICLISLILILLILFNIMLCEYDVIL